MTIANLLLALHLLSAVIWVGGMAFALLVLRPAIGVLAPPLRMTLHMEVFRRFFKLVWHVAPLLLITGDIMVFYVFGGFRHVPWPVHAMHGTGAIMATLFLYLFFVPWRTIRRAVASGDQDRATAALTRIRRLITVNLVLGAITIVLAAIN